MGSSRDEALEAWKAWIVEPRSAERTAALAAIYKKIIASNYDDTPSTAPVSAVVEGAPEEPPPPSSGASA